MPPLQFDEQEIMMVMDNVVKRTFRMDHTWDWPAGVAFYGVARAYETTGRREYIEPLMDWVDEHLQDGLPRLSVNRVSIGHCLISLYEATGEQSYVEIASQMAEFLKNDAARFADGIFQHTVGSGNNDFPEQAWVDTLMMAGYFLLRMAKLLDRSDYLEDGLRQYHGHEEFLQDSQTDLYYHGWDHVRQNHMSGIFWARGNAWAAYTMAKALAYVKVQHPSYMMIEGSLRDQLSALVRLQHDSGLWHTILTDKDSYLETSGSAGIAAALLTRGSLYNKFANKSVAGLLEQIREDGAVLGVSAGTAVMDDAEGYKGVSCKRIQGWGQGLMLAFLAELLERRTAQDDVGSALDDVGSA